MNVEAVLWAFLIEIGIIAVSVSYLAYQRVKQRTDAEAEKRKIVAIIREYMNSRMMA